MPRLYTSKDLQYGDARALFALVQRMHVSVVVRVRWKNECCSRSGHPGEDSNPAIRGFHELDLAGVDVRRGYDAVAADASCEATVRPADTAPTLIFCVQASLAGTKDGRSFPIFLDQRRRDGVGDNVFLEPKGKTKDGLMMAVTGFNDSAIIDTTKTLSYGEMLFVCDCRQGPRVP